MKAFINNTINVFVLLFCAVSFIANPVLMTGIFILVYLFDRKD